MKYSFIELTIRDLVELIEKNQVDLNPSYQRNFIWSPKDQKELIDTIILSYPLPSFFMYKKTDGSYEMVDGQQRSKTIFSFVKGLITSSKRTGNVSFDRIDKEKFLNYKLSIILIEDLSQGESLNEYYVWINKKGVHLNSSEMIKSEFHDTNFLKLASELLTYQNLIDLDLFSENTSKRMNDRAFIEELLGYLQLGIREKKKSVEYIYNEEDITPEEYEILKERFQKIIDVVYVFNQIKPIKSTRYKQKNDFYTLFNFLDENLFDDIETLNYQYKILLFVDGKDPKGRQYIRPTNEGCQSLKNYALNCVSQSNSKLAREYRLNFFEAILKNVNVDANEILKDVLNYFMDEIELDLRLKRVGNFELIDIDRYEL